MPTEVVIIEDNPEFLFKFTEVIKGDPEFLFKGSARTAAEGISLIERSRADVYLVDLGLPDMSGIEVIKHATKTYPDCDAIVVTVFGDDTNVIESIEAGATGYVLKDSSYREILDCIRTIRHGGAPVSPLIARKILKKFHTDNRTIISDQIISEHPPQPEIEALTDRETQILRALSKGLSFNEIGEMHTISPHTVARHVKKIYRKLAVHSRGEAVYEATKMGIINI